jgi:hypothetical protein
MRVQWTIVVTAAVGDEEAAAQLLKGLLKVALRRFGMRCTTVSETRLVPSPLVRGTAVYREAARREERGRERGGRERDYGAGLFG